MKKRADHTLKRWTLILLLAAGYTAAGTTAEPYIVRDGKPLAEIVVATNATRTARLAAEQLQEFVRKMSGATLPIVTAPSGGDAVRIYIGSAAADVGVTAEGLKYGAYHVRSGENWLALVGDDTEFVPTEPYRLTKSPEDSEMAWEKWKTLVGEPFGMPNSQLCMDMDKGFFSDERIWAHDQWGSFNAVVDFLRSLGCRWYVPHEIGEVVSDVNTIALPRVDKTVKPDFAWRGPAQENRKFRQSGATREEVLWQMRLGLYFGYDIVGPGIAHGMVQAYGGYREEHPDWFALQGGKRNTEFRNQGQPCLSSEGLFEANVRYVRKVFDILDLPAVSVMPCDAYGGCGCPLCKDKATPERGWAGTLSDYVWTYVDRVAREVYKTHPDKKITCLAYGTYLLPPTTIERLSPNLLVGIAQYRIGFDDDKRKQLFRQLRQDWLDKTPQGSKQFWLYEYYRSAGNANPAYFPRLIAEDMRSLKGICLGEYNDMTRSPEGIRNMAVDHLNLYVTARCQWDAELDLDALLEDYYTKFYGPAREPMKAFIEYCETHRATLLKDAAQIDTALGHLNSGLAAAPEGSIYRTRIEWIGQYFALLPDLKAQLAKGRPEVPVAKARSGWGNWVIDGKNDDEPWRKFGGGGGSLRELTTGGAPTFGTTFQLVSTDKQLYIWISCADLKDAPLNIQGTENDAADIWNGDVVEILLEPPGHSYYQIAINPAGIVTDLDRGGNGLAAFNTLWSANAEVATTVENGRWNVEIRIPFAGAGMDDIDPDNGVAGNQPTEQVPWYFNICRQRLRQTGTELSAFSPTGGARGFHDPDRFGRLEVDFGRPVREY